VIHRPVSDGELHAFVDGELEAVRRADVEAWLADNPEAAARVTFYRQLNEALHRRYDHVLSEPVPPAMLHPSRRRLPATMGRAALAASLLVASFVGGWFANQALRAPQIVERVVQVPVPMTAQAAMAHAIYAAEVRHPVEVGADEEAHLMRWLSNRMGREVKAPHLQTLGYRLMGGRLLPAADGGAACQFMYENASGTRVTLFIRNADADQKETAFHFKVESNGVSVFYWIDRHFGYALSANLPREELLRLARAIYDQLSL